jgi:hypothetical protein
MGGFTYPTNAAAIQKALAKAPSSTHDPKRNMVIPCRPQRYMSHLLPG